MTVREEIVVLFSFLILVLGSEVWAFLSLRFSGWTLVFEQHMTAHEMPLVLHWICGKDLRHRGHYHSCVPNSIYGNLPLCLTEALNPSSPSARSRTLL